MFSQVLLSFQGQPLLPSLQLQSVLQLWLQIAPSSNRIQTTVGSSGKEFVMVLNYSMVEFCSQCRLMNSHTTYTYKAIDPWDSIPSMRDVTVVNVDESTNKECITRGECRCF